MIHIKCIKLTFRALQFNVSSQFYAYFLPNRKTPKLTAKDNNLFLTKAIELSQSQIEIETDEKNRSLLHEGLAVADILHALEMPETIRCSAILSSLVHIQAISPEQIQKQFSREVRELVNDLGKLDSFSHFDDINEQEGLSPKQAEGLRKLLLAIVDDIRLVLVRLAQQLHRLRESKNATESERRRLAQETSEVFAPLANRLGIWQLKWELEDLAFRYLEPQQYKDIAKWLSSKRSERETYIENFKQTLRDMMLSENIQADIQGRPKHIYSIWKKMQRKSSTIESLFDIRAVRIITQDITGCYTALGIVHNKWKYVPSEFDDYVANPKANNYQSIHTAVFGPDNKVVEIQIRSQEMHDNSELGVAAHWRYKEGAQQSGLDEKINWLRHVLESKHENESQGTRKDEDFIHRFRETLFEDRVYAVSPRGDVVDMSAGSTPLDFAYHIHTEVGHRCRGALVNGKIVPLTYKIQNGDRIEILTSKESKPSRDWLIDRMGYIASSRSREKIRSWFRLQDQDQNLKAGKQLLERELTRLGVENKEPDTLANKHGFPSYHALCISLGAGALTIGDVTSSFIKDLENDEESGNDFILRRRTKHHRSSGQIAISGVDDLLTNSAQCCKPVPPEAIVGYITQGKGITIHRANCKNLQNLIDKRPERVFDVSWNDTDDKNNFIIDVAIEAYDRKNLIRDITGLLSEEKITILEMSSKVDKKQMTASVTLQIEVENFEAMSRIMNKLESLPTIYSVTRV